MFKTYEEAVDWITGKVSLGIRPGLKRMEYMMERLGHPERRLKFVHVAGTNGKGSVCSYIAGGLRHNGYRTGLFTSPYLYRYAERIQVDGVPIPDDDLVSLCNRLMPLAQELEQTEWGSPSMFELSTSLAILYFAEIALPDFVVWETGLGGRLDSTNIVHPLVSVITNVGHDHMDILGDTIGKIAGEKAGIIKNGVPVVCGAEQPEAVAVIRETAKERKSTLYLAGEAFRYVPVHSEIGQQRMDFHGPFRSFTALDITMNGIHQMNNAALAVMTLELLRQYYAVVVEDESLRAGLFHTTWPGRLEWIPGNPPILLDGAHNPEGAEALASALRALYRHDKLRVVLGMLKTKHHRGFLRHILPLVDTLIVTEPTFGNRMAASELAGLAEEQAMALKRDVDIVVEPSWKQALTLLRARTGNGDLALVTGTLYLISDVRTWLLYGKDSDKGW